MGTEEIWIDREEMKRMQLSKEELLKIADALEWRARAERAEAQLEAARKVLADIRIALDRPPEET